MAEKKEIVGRWCNRKQCLGEGREFLNNPATWKAGSNYGKPKQPKTEKAREGKK